MFSATVAENRKLSSATKAISERSDATSTVAQVGAVDQHRAPARVVEPRQQRRPGSSCPTPVGPTSATVRPGSTSSSMSSQRGRAAVVGERDVAQLDRARGPSGSGGASGGLSIRGSRSRISNSRLPEATARCAIPSDMPSMRIGPVSMIR